MLYIGLVSVCYYILSSKNVQYFKKKIIALMITNKEVIIVYLLLLYFFFFSSPTPYCTRTSNLLQCPHTPRPPTPCNPHLNDWVQCPSVPVFPDHEYVMAVAVMITILDVMTRSGGLSRANGFWR